MLIRWLVVAVSTRWFVAAWILLALMSLLDGLAAAEPPSKSAAAPGEEATKPSPNSKRLHPFVAVASYQDATEELHKQIAAKLAAGKLLIVWCLDQSENMQGDRDEIAELIPQLYKKLAREDRDVLQMAVTSFGENWSNHTSEPTSHISTLVEAVKEIPDDPTGVEQTCPAIVMTLATYRQFARQERQMMLIVVTDESGDLKTNTQYLESTIAEARAANCPIYFLGCEAMFGYPWAHLQSIDEKTNQAHVIPIDRGPESPFPETLQTDGFRRRTDTLPSGFGPYEQSRIAQETGGLFFILPSPELEPVARDKPLVEADLARLQAYLPDLRSKSDYLADRDKNVMHKSIWKIIEDLNPYDMKHNGRVEMQLEFPIDLPSLTTDNTRELGEAQQLVLYLQGAQTALEKLRPQRESESNRRWQANYDLLYAQTIAYPVRLQEYGALIDSTMKNPPPILNLLGAEKPTNRWAVQPVARLLTGDKHQPAIEQATKLFKQIVRDHPGTPWAMRAEAELKREYGVELRETYVKLPNSGPVSCWRW